jgi:glutamate racemase
MIASKTQAIGIFDSGVGGLTVMKEIVELLPHENIVYFGDTARLPYGEKSPETIIRYSIENAKFLHECDIKVLVIACNTASAYAIENVRQFVNIPVIGVIEPGAAKAVEVTKLNRIAVLGTKATIKSGVYQKEIEKRLPGCFVLAKPCPLFVPLVEENFILHPVTEMVVKEYLLEVRDAGIDTLLLGCTHYPLLKEIIQMEVGNAITIVDSASLCAENLKTILLNHDLSNTSVTSAHRYFVSDDPEKFMHLGSQFLGTPLQNVLLVN